MENPMKMDDEQGSPMDWKPSTSSQTSADTAELRNPFCIHQIHREHFAGALTNHVMLVEKGDSTKTLMLHIVYIYIILLHIDTWYLGENKKWRNLERKIVVSQPRALVKVRQPAAATLTIRIQQILGRF